MNKTLTVIILFCLALIFFSSELIAKKKNQKNNSKREYLIVKPKSGDGIQTLFNRYGIDLNKESKSFFFEKNEGKFFKANGLVVSKEYFLPIEIIKLNESIAKSIKKKDADYIDLIAQYNENVENSGIKTDKSVIWVPLFISKIKETKIEEEKLVTKMYPIFGEKYQEVKQLSNKLKNKVFYLVSGHGGPDPGAVGSRSGYELNEDEYAYDVTLRLARKIIENGGIVYIMVQDEDDGIRDNQFLNNDNHELLIDGSIISPIQKTRLQQRTELINKYYQKNKDEYSQYVVEIHVDSRINQKGIDIFFYYNPGSDFGEKLATIMLNTLSEKYEKAQPGRGYHGTVSARNLHTLRESKPVGVYIELGNIQNPRDQIRLIEPNNRQAIANWLCDGLIKGLRK